jgi:glyoxylase-like metal-dependent hydrolase (beta-lactamase superfamily II)
MSFTRRHFLQQSTLAATGCLGHVLLNASCAPRRARVAWTAPRDPVVATTPFARLEAIGPDAWAVVSTPLGGDRTTFANGGLIAGTSGVVAIEGFYRAAGAAWLAQQARAVTGRWPTHVVLTHYHVDHASGTAGYSTPDGAPRLHVTATTQRLALSGGPVAPVKDVLLERQFADVVVVRADAPTRIDLGNRVLMLTPFRGHTASDLVVDDDDAALCWSGDLVWHRMFPNFTDATPTQLAASVRVLASRLDRQNAVLVPGHGARIDRRGMQDYLGLLDGLEGAARTGHRTGRSAAEVAAAYRVPESLGEWMASAPSVTRAITAWYRELG